MEELKNEIRNEIKEIKKALERRTFSDEKSDATNRIALSNLYIALSHLESAKTISELVKPLNP